MNSRMSTAVAKNGVVAVEPLSMVIGARGRSSVPTDRLAVFAEIRAEETRDHGLQRKKRPYVVKADRAQGQRRRPSTNTSH